MKEIAKKKTSVLVTDSTQKEEPSTPGDASITKMERFKKPLVFSLLGIVFLGCMYLIFAPSSSEKAKKLEDIGLNEDVPEATDKGMQSDKKKAYEEEILKEKQQKTQEALKSLSDYWNSDGNGKKTSDSIIQEEKVINTSNGSIKTKANSALNSYNNIQSTLDGFYEQNDSENNALRKELAELKMQEKQREPTLNPMETQLALMEKSYQMAAKYLPKASQNDTEEKETTLNNNTASSKKESFVAFLPLKKNTVSALYRESKDTEFIKNWDQERNLEFIGSDTINQVVKPKNSIRACIHKTQTITLESNVRLRLLEETRTPTRTIPKGTLLTAMAKFQEGRLQLQVISLELDGNIIPVDITVYDLDGQQGLYLPYTSEMNTLKEIAANMGTTAGTNIMLSSSPGQQIVSDMSKGVIQGVSSYFSKKVKTTKITLKAGHQLFLVSKK